MAPRRRKAPFVVQQMRLGTVILGIGTYLIGTGQQARYSWSLAI
jgi:hypothetical protein